MVWRLTILYKNIKYLQLRQRQTYELFNRIILHELSVPIDTHLRTWVFRNAENTGFKKRLCLKIVVFEKLFNKIYFLLCNIHSLQNYLVLQGSNLSTKTEFLTQPKTKVYLFRGYHTLSARMHLSKYLRTHRTSEKK